MPRLIIGHTTHNSAKIWVRGTERWPFAFITVFEDNGTKVASRKLALDAEEFFTNAHQFTSLRANKAYVVKVAFGQDADARDHEKVREAYTQGRFKTFPPSGSAKFSFVLGSCNLHSLGVIKNPDRAWSRISKIAEDADAKFMIHCGDQIYADIPRNPPPNIDHYRRKYIDAWEDCKPAQRVLTERPHYMILDDHEIDNNFDRADFDDENHINMAMKAYYEFQHQHNPTSPSSDSQRNYHYTFSHGSVEFFVLDTRYKRNSDLGEMIDSSQLRRLKAWLKSNANKQKFVVTSVPFVGEVRNPKKDKWCDPVYKDQRFEILKHILANSIKKVTFLTGDMHKSYHAKFEVSDGQSSTTIHELMASPINQVTPPGSVSDTFHATKTTVANGISAKSTIDGSSYYGNHSNVMVISVLNNTVSYKIERTRKTESGPRGSFST